MGWIWTATFISLSFPCFNTQFNLAKTLCDIILHRVFFKSHCQRLKSGTANFRSVIPGLVSLMFKALRVRLLSNGDRHLPWAREKKSHQKR